MKRLIIFILFFRCCLPIFSQVNELANTISQIKEQHGDSIARNYLESKKDSLEQVGESILYMIYWGLLTSNMWNANPNEKLQKEYRDYLNLAIDDEVKDAEFVPSSELLPSLWQLASDYYKILYEEGDKEGALAILSCIHRWFKPYEDARNTIGYANSLLDLCIIMVRDMHKYKESEPYCREYAQIAKSVYGDSSGQYAVSLYNITILPHIKSEEKIDLLNKAISIYEHTDSLQPETLSLMKQSYEIQIAETTGIANTEAIDYFTEGILPLGKCSMLIISGRGELALESLIHYKKQIKDDQYLDTITYVNVVNLLCQAYMEIGNWASAESEITELENFIDLEELPAGLAQPFYSATSLIACRLKDYSKAIRYSLIACKQFNLTGDFGLEYTKVLGNLAIVYAEAGEYFETDYCLNAKWYIDEAISIFEERIGSLFEHGNVGITLLNNKAAIYGAIGDIKGAVSVLEEIVNNFSNNIDVREGWLLAANNLSTMYMKQGRWTDGAKLLEKLEGMNDEYNYLFAQNLALCRMYMKDNSQTSKAVEKMNHYSINNVANIFSYFASIERDDYWSQISKERICINNLVAYHTNDNQAISMAYDNALFCKLLLLNFSIILDRYFTQTLNNDLKKDYLKYKELKENLAFKAETQPVKDSLSREITIYEKKLLSSISDFEQLLNKETKTWKDVQQHLEDDEIAIEYCYAPRMEKYPDLQPYYGAFVLRKDFEFPKLVSLENVDTVEDIFDRINPDAFFINDLYTDKSKTLFEMLWDKLTPYMKNIKTIYYSPTGELSNINFDVLYGKDGIMLGDKYKMIRLSSTAKIGDIKTSYKLPLQTSVLYGNIEYDETTSEMSEASSAYKLFSGTEIQSELSLRSENERGRWGAIPSTKDEIDNIDKLLSKKGIKVSKYEETTANEESFKTLSGNSPDIIHLATHGFVIDTPQRAEGNKFFESTSIYSRKDSYMMWTGLMLAGGNNIWQGKFDLSNVEDGVLTADEISRLDLSDTKLVVLSACETARGKIDPVDGVYGLQRAFKIAGVQTIVMSLWKVQDDATSMLMTQFYKYLTDGIEKHQALWKAMMAVKEKYPDPYYWAGFIMLD